MRDRAARIVAYRVASVPNAMTQISVFEVVEELRIEAAKFFYEFAPDQYEAAGEPSYLPFVFAIPTDILANAERWNEARHLAEAQREAPFRAHRGQGPDASLKCAIAVQYSAAERAALRVRV